jgi:hypothetical protein
MATDARIRNNLDGDVSSDLPAHAPEAPGAGLDKGRGSAVCLTACSRCLRVLWDETWVLAELVIREVRSYEHAAPPRFEPVLCGVCTRSIAQRRAQARVPLEQELARSRG